MTLIELVVTLAVMAILTAVAAPGFRHFLVTTRLSTEGNELVSALAVARNEAVIRGTTLSVCPSADAVRCAGTNWSVGWIVFTDTATAGQVDAPDDVIVRASPSLREGSSLAALRAGAAVQFIRYLPTGFLEVDQTVDFTLKMSPCEGGRARRISVAPSGRVNPADLAC